MSVSDCYIIAGLVFSALSGSIPISPLLRDKRGFRFVCGQFDLIFGFDRPSEKARSRYKGVNMPKKDIGCWPWLVLEIEFKGHQPSSGSSCSMEGLIVSSIFPRKYRPTSSLAEIVGVTRLTATFSLDGADKQVQTQALYQRLCV